MVSLFVNFLLPTAPGEAPRYLKINMGMRFASPSLDHPFGTDNLGRDVFARVISGAKVSLGIAALAVLVMVIFAIPLGLLSGY